jgi:magnesium-protoporphyrin IX monomethyl ester (oxidative) cyclase
MVIRDHARPAFHKALNVDIEWYDREVLRITSEISKQVFPIEIDLENPRWEKGLRRLRKYFDNIEQGKRERGIFGSFKRVYFSVLSAQTFVSLFLIPVKKNNVPEDSSLQPTY